MKLYTGCVENRLDPLHLGRCQVRVLGLHTEDKTLLPTDDLPWAYPIQPITSAGVSGVGSVPLGPVEGTWVAIIYADADEQQPIMLGTLAGSFQTAEAVLSGTMIYNKVDADGTVTYNGVPGGVGAAGTTNPIGQTPGNGSVTTPGSGAVSKDMEQGKPISEGSIITDKNSIIGPLAKLIAKGESGAAGYNAFNRGSGAKPGTGSIGGEKLQLTQMPIKDIMAKQALNPNSPERLFAVGKYQCIPITLREACTSLNIDVNCTFNEVIQDRICQEYLVGKKRPPLVAYYRNPDVMNEALLKAAGKSLAAEFASIEDPDYPGYPYGGPDGKYYKNGNKVHTTWAIIKSTLIQEWQFRNGKMAAGTQFATSPGAGTTSATSSGGSTAATTPKLPPTIQATNEKVDKGTDIYGVAKITPPDDSSATAPREQASSSTTSGFTEVTESFNLASVVPNLSGLGGAAGLANLGLSTDVLSGLSNGLIQGIASSVQGIKELVGSIDLNGSLADLGFDSSILSDFGSSLSEVAGNLGISASSVTELADNLGLANPSSAGIVAELTRLAKTPEGQAKAMLAKFDATPEPTVRTAVPVGERNPDGSISNGTPVDPTMGFQDPNGAYPRYKNEPDTNRLATGNNLGRTYVLKKEAERKTDVKIANGGTWDQVPVPYNARYPYNKVQQTESGHILEFDDTPGSERIHQWHKSGTFTEIDPNGTQVNRIVGDGYEIIERNGCVYVKGALNVTVDGALNVRTDNIMNLEVSGAVKVNIYNNAAINVSGNCDLAVGAELNAKAAKINLESTGQFNIKSGSGLNIQAAKDINIKTAASCFLQTTADVNVKTTGSFFLTTAVNTNIKATNKINIQSTADTNIKSAAKINVESTADANVKSGAKVNVQSSADLNLKSGAVANLQSGGQMNLRAGGMLAADAGSIVDIQNGSAGSAGGSDSAGNSTEAVDAKNAGQADLELPIELRGTSGVAQLPFLIPPTRSAEVGFDSPGSGDYAGYSARSVSTNAVGAYDLERDRAAMETNIPNVTPSMVPVGAKCDAIFNMPADQYTAGMKLSKYFTLGDLTKGGERIPRVTYDLNGEKLTPQQIVCNLKGLAENVLDPIREKFGPFTITSAFRRPPFGTIPGDLGGQKEGGDHPRGCAADIVFPGSKEETYAKVKEIVKIIPTWNQVIMEYNGNQFWIHVAFKYSGNKGDMFTMNHHKTYAGTYPRGGFVLA